MVEEEEEVEDDGKTGALAKGGVTGLSRTTGRTSLARKVGGISLVRIACTETQASLLYRHHQEGTKTNIKTRGLGASRSRAQSLASLGGAQAPASQRIFKQFAREVNAVLPKLEATRPLRWSACAITFSSAYQLKCAATAGVLPMLCSWESCPSRRSTISKCRTISFSQPSPSQESLMVPLFR